MRLDELTAALVWEPAVLAQSVEPGAKAFYNAMHFRALDTTELSELIAMEDPLLVAAAGLSHEFSERQADARDSYQRLLAMDNPSAQLLGAALLAWMQQSTPDDIQRARRLASQGRPSRVKTRYLLKLLAFALDRGWMDIARELFDLATARAKQWPALRPVLSQVGYSYFRLPLEFREHVPHDDFVQGAWIPQATARAARAALVDLLRRKVRSPWRTQIRFGLTEVDEIAAIEMQTVWSGAIWWLPTLRLQLGAQLLSGGADSPHQFGLGLAMWILGNGRDAFEVADFAEPHFDKDTAAEVLVDHLKRGQRAGAQNGFAESAASLWDVISDSEVEWLLLNTVPTGGDSPNARALTSLWAVLSIRQPSLWSQRLRRLPRDARLPLVEMVSPGVADRLPEPAARELFELTREELQSERLKSYEALRFYLRLAMRLGEEISPELLARANVAMLAHLAFAEGHPMLARACDERMEELVTAARKAVSDGERGTIHMFVHDPLVGLGYACAAIPSEPSNQTLEFLVDAVVQSRLPSEIRYRAATGLALVSQRHRLPRPVIERLLSTTVAVDDDSFSGVSASLLQARVVQAAASGMGALELDARLLNLVRDPDPRVRQLAVLTAASNEHLSGSALQAVLVSALFDPDPTVLVDALNALRRRMPPAPGLETLLVGRFQTLLSTGTRQIRDEVARAASGLQDQWSSMGPIVERASSDRSWVVRETAKATQDVSGAE